MSQSCDVLLSGNYRQHLCRRVPFREIVSEDEVSGALMKNADKVPKVFRTRLDRGCCAQQHMIAAGCNLPSERQKLIRRPGVRAKPLTAARLVGFIENHNTETQRH